MAQMMSYNGYRASVWYDDEDSLFVGSVFGINDSLNFHGTTVAELKDAFHSCVDSYLEMCHSLGVEPEKEYKGVFNVRISPELHKQIALAAENEHIPMNQFIAKTLASAVHYTA